MTMVGVTKTRQEAEERTEYDHRMLVNLAAASFMTLLMITSYCVVSTLAETMAH